MRRLVVLIGLALCACGQRGDGPQRDVKPAEQPVPTAVDEGTAAERRQKLDAAWEHGRSMLGELHPLTLGAENRYKRHLAEHMPPSLATAPSQVRAAYRDVMWKLASLANQDWKPMNERIRDGLQLKTDEISKLLDLWSASAR